jgi:hypothetical protein
VWDQLKQYIDESVKGWTCSYEKSTAPNFPSHEHNTEPLAPNTSAANGSSCTQPLYGMPMNTFVAPPQPPPPDTRPTRNIVGPFEGHLGPFGYITDRPTYFVRPSDPTQVRAQTTQVAPYTVGPSGYTLGLFGPGADRLAHYARPSGYTYAEPGAAQYAQFLHPSQQHYATLPAAYYNHDMPPHMHRAQYSSATIESERYRAGGVVLIGDLHANKIMSSNLRFTSKLNGWSLDVVEKLGTP